MSEQYGAAYIRVSTDRQEELSPDAQKRLILDYAKKNSIIISEDMIFQDIGISGKRAEKREEFRRMIATAKSEEHPFDVILVWKFSRFARNQEESIVYKNLLRKCNVDVVSISEPVIDGAFGSLIERIIEWMDEYYSTNLSTEVIRGMTEKALKGGYQAPSPIGYKRNEQNIPEIYEPEAQIVRTIYSQFLNGYDITVIARNMNNAGYKTRQGNPFEFRTVRYILENPFYIGKVRWNRTKHSSYRENNPDEIIIADGKHEPLIPQKTFDTAAELLKRYTNYATKKKTAAVCKHWLSGLIKCPVCGASMSYNNPLRAKRKISPYWQCYKYTKGMHNGSQAISEQTITESVLSSISNIIKSGNVLFSYSTHNDSPNATTYANQLKKLAAKEKRIKAAYIDGIDSLEEYKENKKKVLLEKEAVQKKLERCQKPRTVAKDEMLERMRTVYDILSNDEIPYEKKSTAVRSIIDKIVYNRDTNECMITYYFS